MIDHLALQVRDSDASSAFYTTVFAALGIVQFTRFERPEGVVVGLSEHDDMPRLWLGPLNDDGHRPVHLALTAPTAAAVDAVHAAALAYGSEVLHAARHWPEYHPGYYGVFLRDPDGNNVEAVCHAATPPEEA